LCNKITQDGDDIADKVINEDVRTYIYALRERVENRPAVELTYGLRNDLKDTYEFLNEEYEKVKKEEKEKEEKKRLEEKEEEKRLEEKEEKKRLEEKAVEEKKRLEEKELRQAMRQERQLYVVCGAVVAVAWAILFRYH
jgi:hypothetical protein